MTRLWQQITKGEKGQALPIVLILLVVGGLLVTPSLNYAATSLNAGRIVKQNVRGIYAADAGVEHVLWQIRNGIEPPEEQQLPENVNQMQVAIETDDMGDYVLYYGELVSTGHHYHYLAVDGEAVWDEEEQAYEYTITVTWQAEQGEPKIHLNEVGVRLPVDFSYQSGSADSFGDNLSREEPEDTLDGAGAYMLNWKLPSNPYVWDPEPIRRTQTFYVTGMGEPEGDYAWVVAGRTDVDIVSEATGKLYRITATATRPGDGEPTARVMADAIFHEATEEIRIILWQINPQ